MTVVEAPRTGRRRWFVVAACLVVVAACAGWWALQLRGSVTGGTADAVVDQHVVPIAAGTVTLADGGVARIAVAVVTSADEEDVTHAEPHLQAALVEHAVTYSTDRLRSAPGADQLRGQLLAKAREVLPDGTTDRIVLTELLVVSP